MIWLFGDSIFRGYATGRFADQLPPGDPRHAWASPSAMLNSALGEALVAVGGLTRLPDEAELAVEEMARFRAEPGDVIVMLDAGHHACDPDVHERQWRALIAAAQTKGVRVLVCNAPDNLAQLNWERGRYKPALWHALKFGARSHNDAVESAARALGADFLDVAMPLHLLNQESEEGLYLADCVHLNRTGQAALCCLIGAKLWPGRRLLIDATGGADA